MKSEFLTELIVQQLNDKKWKLQSELRYVSKVARDLIIVPCGFITDFASVPRLPITYLYAGNTAHEAAVVHDYCYRVNYMHNRKLSDMVFLEAMKVTGVPFWRRYPMYMAVRIIGQVSWDK